jgi:6-phosphogluconolactonase (cycloisomerase 2 family)
LLSTSCTIVIVSGPSTVSVGDTVTYVLDLANNFGGDSNVALYVIADVPAGWTLLSSTFDAVIDGVPTSGEGSLSGATPCGTLTGDVLPGFQRLVLFAGPFATVTGNDTGTATLELDVGSQPAGEFKIFFRFAGSGTNGGDCSEAAVRTINRDGADFLTFVGALFDGVGGVDGLSSPRSLTASPDGRHVLAADDIGDSLAVFSRDEYTGELAFVEALIDGAGGIDGLNGANSAAVSPDGTHVYATAFGDDALTVFSRDEATGELTQVQVLVDGVGGADGLGQASHVAISPDGKHVYTAALEHAIAVFARDQLSGELTFVEVLFDGVAGVDGLEGANTVAVSPDGLHVYAAALFDEALSVFSRDPESGELTFVEALFEGVGGVEGLSGLSSLALTADGRHLYTAAAGLPDAVGVFSRDAKTGELEKVEVQVHGSGGVFGLEHPTSVTVATDGGHVFAGGINSVVVFARDPDTGALTFVEAQFQGDPPNQGLDGTSALTTVPGDRHLYAASTVDDALVTFGASLIFADGFESGDLSRW